MKGAALKKFLKKGKSLYLMDNDGLQWVSARSAAYPLDGYPRMDEESLLTVLEIPEGKREGYHVLMMPRPNDMLAELMQDMMSDEGANVRLGGITITAAEAGSYKPAYTPDGVQFVEEEALRPLADVLDKCQLVYRNTGKMGAIVVMLGMMTVGVLMCVNGWADVQVQTELRAAAQAAEQSGQGSSQGEQMKMEEGV